MKMIIIKKGMIVTTISAMTSRILIFWRNPKKRIDLCFSELKRWFISKEEIGVYKNFDPKMKRKVGGAKEIMLF